MLKNKIVDVKKVNGKDDGWRIEEIVDGVEKIIGKGGFERERREGNGKDKKKLGFRKKRKNLRRKGLEIDRNNVEGSNVRFKWLVM